MEQLPDLIEVEGEVVEVLPSTLFRVKIYKSVDVPELTDRVILCHISGKMRRNYIKLMVGDKVRVGMSPKYDLERGRITYRIK